MPLAARRTITPTDFRLPLVLGDRELDRRRFAKFAREMDDQTITTATGVAGRFANCGIECDAARADFRNPNIGCIFAAIKRRHSFVVQILTTAVRAVELGRSVAKSFASTDFIASRECVHD